MRYQPMSPERLDAIREALKVMNRCDVLREFKVSSNTLTKYQLHKAEAVDRRFANITPEQVEMIRRLSAEGYSDARTAELAGTSRRQVRRVREKHGITVDFSKRPAAAEKTAKPKGRNPMHHLMSWKPPTSTTSLEVAIDRLRTKVPVFAEDTRRRPDKPPKPYTPETVFIVGNKRMTGAEILESA